MNVSYNEAKRKIGHITDDINILMYFSYTDEAQWECPYGMFENNFKYNDDYLCVYYYDVKDHQDDYYSDGHWIGTSYSVYLKNGQKRQADMIKVFDAEIVDKHGATPSAKIETYRPGYWEEYLHKIATNFKIRLEEIEERKNNQKYLKESEERRKQEEKEYQMTLRFKPIDDKGYFGK